MAYGRGRPVESVPTTTQNDAPKGWFLGVAQQENPQEDLPADSRQHARVKVCLPETRGTKLSIVDKRKTRKRICRLGRATIRVKVRLPASRDTKLFLSSSINHRKMLKDILKLVRALTALVAEVSGLVQNLAQLFSAVALVLTIIGSAPPPATVLGDPPNVTVTAL